MSYDLCPKCGCIQNCQICLNCASTMMKARLRAANKISEDVAKDNRLPTFKETVLMTAAAHNAPENRQDLPVSFAMRCMIKGIGGQLGAEGDYLAAPNVTPNDAAP